MAVATYKTADVRLWDVGADPDQDGRMTLNGSDLKLRSNGIVYNLSHLPVSVRKEADQILNNDTTLTDDDDLVIPIGANETWHIQGSLEISAAPAADHKMRFSIPAGCGGVWASTIGSNHITDATLLTVTIIYQTLGVAIRMHRQFFAKVVNGATAGNIQVQWAQNAADVSDLTVYAGSSLLGWRVN